MLRFLEGVKPPEKRQKLTDAEKKEKGQIYEKKKRKRKILETWKEGRKWLNYDNEKMTCSWCIDNSGNAKPSEKSSFISGCQNFKLDSVTFHEKSEFHKKSAAVYNAKQKGPDNPSIASKVLQALNTNVFNRLKILFRNVHALVKNRRPFTDFLWLCKLDEVKGVDVGETYRNDKQVLVFLHYIAEASQREIVKSVCDAKFLSVICDGCTDTAVQEEEIIYIRTCIGGEIECVFLAIDNPERADASGVFACIENALDCANISDWRKKIVGFGSDGANVMMGKNSGVFAKLKAIQPSLQGVHCFSHRLELAYKDALKKAPYYPRMQTLLQGLYLFYHYSPLNRQNLKRSFDALNVVPLMPTRTDGTRWLPHTVKALEHMWGVYAAIKTYLQQIPQQKGASADVQGKSKGFLKILCDPVMVKFMLFMSDVVTLLAKLSLMFQDNKACVTDIKQKLDATYTILQKYKTKDGPRLRKLETISNLTGMDFSKADMGISRDTILTSLQACLQNRFSDTVDGVIGACRVANLKTWPLNLNENEDFGDADITLLVEHFRQVLLDAGLNPDAIWVEWDLLKSFIYKNFKDVAALSWQNINAHCNKQGFDNILTLVDLIHTLPAHSADAERGFSEMKLVKTDWRSRLRPKVLSDLLFVMLHTDDISSFDPTDAINLWNAEGVRVRRPSILPYGTREVNEVEEFLDVWTELDPDYLDKL